MAVRELTYVKAYNEALHQVMAEDEDVFVVGEDVAGYGGVFRMYDGLLETYGDRRMIDTPISEMAIVGLGVGAASRGLRVEAAFRTVAFPRRSSYTIFYL